MHFDGTAERGLTPYARWRGTQRHQIKPWADQCEQRLPGQIVRATSRPHLHFLLLGLLYLAWMGHWLVDSRRHGTPWQATGYALAALFGLRALVQLPLASVGTLMNVRISDETEQAPRAVSAPAGQPGTHGYILEYVVRWPGRFGLGISVLTRHLDEAGKPIPAPRPFGGVRTVRTDASPRKTRSLLGGIVVRYRAVVVDRIDRYSGLTSLQLAVQALARLLSIVLSGVMFAVLLGLAALGVVPFGLLRTTGQIAIYAAVFLLLIVRSGFGVRGSLRLLKERLLRPRVPTDLVQEPFALYLRPHPDDPFPLSPWTGPLDLDLRETFSATGRLFRVGHMPLVAPPPGLARLPLPEDGWQERLTEALPYAGLVVLPTVGTAPTTLRQLTEAIRLLPPNRLLLVIPSGEGADEEYGRFRSAAERALAERRAALIEDGQAAVADIALPPRLPAVVPDPDRAPALCAAILFDADWTAVVLPFDELEAPFAEIPRPTQLQRIKEKLDAALARPVPA